MEVNSTWLINSELANQRARKELFTSVVYTKRSMNIFIINLEETELRKADHTVGVNYFVRHALTSSSSSSLLSFHLLVYFNGHYRLLSWLLKL